MRLLACRPCPEVAAFRLLPAIWNFVMPEEELRCALVTGASGFIGRRLCRRLRAAGWRVHALMRRAEEGPWDLQHRLDLGESAVPAAWLEGVDTVFHLAGRVHAVADTTGAEGLYRRVNLHGTESLLEAGAAAGVHAFVYFSSVKAMGEGGGERCWDEAVEPAPVTPYGRSKLEAERRVLGGGFVSHPVVLRPPLVYGPGAGGNIPRMIEAIRRGRFPPLPRVDNRRSMVHVDDLVEAALLVATADKAAGQVYLVTDHQLYSTGMLYQRIRAELGLAEPRWQVPLGVLRAAALVGDVGGRLTGRRMPLDSAALDKLLGSECYDSTKLREALGFTPRHCLWEALPDMVAAGGAR